MGKRYDYGEKKLQAIRLLASGKTMKEVAKQLEVHEKTVQYWCKQDDFKKSLEDIKAQVIDQTIETSAQSINEQVQALLPDAFKVLSDIVKNPDSRNADKLKAIQLVGKWAGMEDKKQPEQSHPEMDFANYIKEKANTN